jgi:hypothetical protein
MKKYLFTFISATIIATEGLSVSYADSVRDSLMADLAEYVEHARDVYINGRMFTFLKLNYGEDQLEELVVDSQGRRLDPAKVKQHYRSQWSKFGRIHPHLYRALEQNDGEALDVVIWLDVDTDPVARMTKPAYVTKSQEEKIDAYLAAKFKRLMYQMRKDKQTLLLDLGLAGWEERGMENSPFVRVKLNRSDIQFLAESSRVRMLMLYEAEGPDDLADAIAIANADEVHDTGITGDGVKVAVFENSPEDTTNLDIKGSYTDSPGITSIPSEHAQHVTAIIQNLTEVDGFAPDVRLYAADRKELAAFDWALDNMRVSVLNQSFHRSAEINDGLSLDDLYKDYRILQYPWPTVVQAAGNWCSAGSICYESGNDVTDEFVNHKGFNSISIGNHIDDASSMRASSCFINPSSVHGDRELPELSANGDKVTADGMEKSGTSMASPAVVGSVALLQEKNQTLKYWPEGVRALLFAGATVNVPSHNGQLSGGGDAADAPNYWWEDVSQDNDGFDGAGALNIGESVSIVNYRWYGKTAKKGWDIGRMESDDFNSGGFYQRVYQVRAEQSPYSFSIPHIRVALAWNSTATMDDSSAEEVYASELGMDLDLRVYDSTGNQVAHSVSWDNSYEIVDFDGKVGETYTIKIQRWSTKPGAWTWFGIAWDTHWQPPKFLMETGFTWFNWN